FTVYVTVAPAVPVNVIVVPVPVQSDVSPLMETVGNGITFMVSAPDKLRKQFSVPPDTSIKVKTVVSVKLFTGKKNVPVIASKVMAGSFVIIPVFISVFL